MTAESALLLLFRILFWSDGGGAHGSISKTAMDGSDPVILFSSDVQPGVVSKPASESAALSTLGYSGLLHIPSLVITSSGNHHKPVPQQNILN